MQKRVIVVAIVIAAYWIFWKASVSDPGFLDKTSAERAIAVFPYDYIIFTPKICSTCSIDK